MVIGKMVWMAMRGRRGAALLQSRLRVKGMGLNVVEDMVLESNNSDGEEEKEDPKITQKCELQCTGEQNLYGSLRV